MICPFCKKPAEWVSNDQVYYGKRYGKSYMIWLCRPCNAYVGSHNNDESRPLGTMANKELREWRIKAHDHIDPLWKSGAMKRSHVYGMLNRLMGRDIHIGASDIETCKQILALDLTHNGKLVTTS
jgi:hypothetical protein